MINELLKLPKELNEWRKSFVELICKKSNIEYKGNSGYDYTQSEVHIMIDKIEPYMVNVDKIAKRMGFLSKSIITEIQISFCDSNMA